MICKLNDTKITKAAAIESEVPHDSEDVLADTNFDGEYLATPMQDEDHTIASNVPIDLESDTSDRETNSNVILQGHMGSMSTEGIMVRMKANEAGRCISYETINKSF